MPRTSVSGRVAVPVNENLITYANDLSNAIWLKTNCSWSANQIANPLDGAMTAGALVDNTTTGLHFFRQLDPPTMRPAISAVVTQSIFAKAGSRGFLIIGANNGGNLIYFDLINGAIKSQQCAGGMQSYGNGWYRCWAVHNLTIARPIYYIANIATSSSYTGSGDNALYLYGAMVNHGRYPSQLAITTGTANTDPVRSKLFPINFGTYSNDYSQWTQTNCTITSNAIADPFTGEMTVSVLSDNTTNGAHGILNPFTAPYTQNAPSTQSVVAKMAPNSTAPMLEMTFAGATATFNLANGTVAGSTTDVQTTRVISLGDGWYRCIAVFTNTTTNGTAAMRINCTTGHGVSAYVGTGNPTMYLTKAQLVQGDRAGDFLTTTTHPVGIGDITASYPEVTNISIRSLMSNRPRVT